MFSEPTSGSATGDGRQRLLDVDVEFFLVEQRASIVQDENTAAHFRYPTPTETHRYTHYHHICKVEETQVCAKKRQFSKDWLKAQGCGWGHRGKDGRGQDTKGAVLGSVIGGDESVEIQRRRHGRRHDRAVLGLLFRITEVLRQTRRKDERDPTWMSE